jgi:hypothetical protein
VDVIVIAVWIVGVVIAIRAYQQQAENPRAEQGGMEWPGAPVGDGAPLPSARVAPATAARPRASRPGRGRRAREGERRRPSWCAVLFDHLVGTGRQAGRYFEAKRLRGLEVDHKLKFGRSLHRKVARLLALA